MSEKYDSRTDTSLHIAKVGQLLAQIRDELRNRGLGHDFSKMHSPEREVFDKVTPRLKGLTYGSDEYKASLAEMGTALDHHYAINRHHPEHWSDGVNDMTLVDVVEMFCDWCAATERHEDGDILKSIKHNEKRFKISHQLALIMRNTALELKMGKRPYGPQEEETMRSSG